MPLLIRCPACQAPLRLPEGVVGQAAAVRPTAAGGLRAGRITWASESPWLRLPPLSRSLERTCWSTQLSRGHEGSRRRDRHEPGRRLPGRHPGALRGRQSGKYLRRRCARPSSVAFGRPENRERVKYPQRRAQAGAWRADGRPYRTSTPEAGTNVLSSSTLTAPGEQPHSSSSPCSKRINSAQFASHASALLGPSLQSTLPLPRIPVARALIKG
jgi:hypothetical protein